MSNAIDKLKLIAEMRKRPELWDFQSEEHKSCSSVAEVWEELAASTGSDAVTCQKNWTQLVKVYRLIVRRIDLRIKHDKLEGLYDPNNDYSSKWPFFKAMQFMKDSKGGPIKPRNSSDRLKLIAEIGKRPILWDFHNEQYKSRINVQETWKDLARTMGSDVESCKRKWKTLRNAYRKEANRIELRIKDDKLCGSYDPNKNYTIKSVYFEAMHFMKIKEEELRTSSDRLKLITEIRKRPALWDNQSEERISPLNVQKNWKDLAHTMGLDVDECKRKWKHLRRAFKAEVNKLEERVEADMLNGSYDPNNVYSCKWAFYEHMKFVEGISKPNNDNHSDDNDSDQFSKLHNMDNIKKKRSYSQTDFAEDLEEVELNLRKSARLAKAHSNDMLYVDESDDEMDTEVYVCNELSDEDDDTNNQIYNEHNLRKSERLNITHSNDMVHVGDSDYNFLVSLLPQMKNMTKLENLEFRENITNLMVNAIEQDTANDTISVSLSQNINSKNYS